MAKQKRYSHKPTDSELSQCKRRVTEWLLEFNNTPESDRPRRLMLLNLAKSQAEMCGIECKVYSSNSEADEA